jgi:glycosyltransferase involved in cell wall biosynthesis
MSTIPFFSIIVPTRGRPELVKNALTSILSQEFADLEVIVVDNNVDDSTSQAVAQFTDKRIKCIKTGNLSLAENWQKGIDAAIGNYVTILSDRMFFAHRFVLGKISQAITETSAEIVSWTWGSFEEHTGNLSVREGIETERRYFINNKDLIHAFLLGDFHWFHHRAPKGLHSCLKKELLQELQSKYGKVCLPISPDYTLGFFTLLHFRQKQTLHLDDTLAVSSFFQPALSNGFATLVSFEKLNSYMSSVLGKDYASSVFAKVYLQNFTQINTIYFDFFRTVRATRSEYTWNDVNLLFYFTTVYDQINLLAGNPFRREWLADLFEKLSALPDWLREAVQAHIAKVNLRSKTPKIFIMVAKILRRLSRILTKILLSPWPRQVIMPAIPAFMANNKQYEQYLRSLCQNQRSGATNAVAASSQHQ